MGNVYQAPRGLGWIGQGHVGCAVEGGEVNYAGLSEPILRDLQLQGLWYC